MQVKLLRVVQEKTVRPIGESREETIDVRILSATHKNLGELVAQGQFREDLFYRINVIELRVPSLRERASDIPEIAEAILHRLGRRTNTESPRLSPDSIELLSRTLFPGTSASWKTCWSVRSRSARATPSHPTTSRCVARRAPVAADAAPLTDGEESSSALGDKLEDMERDAIVKGAGEDPLQQDGGRETAGNELSRSTLPGEEAGGIE